MTTWMPTPRPDRLRHLAILAVLSGLGAAVTVEAQTGPPQTGTWRVTQLTGTITTRSSGPAPPEGICHQSEDTYRARRQNSFIELQVLDEPDVGAGELSELIAAEFTDLVPTKAPEVDEAHAFIFHFEFENGRHSNEALSGQWVAHRQDNADSFGLTKLLFPLGGVVAYVGSWGAESGTVLGMEALQSGGGDNGKSLFTVTGAFAGSGSKIEGEWTYNEAAQLFDYECTTASTGKGEWMAERR